MDFVQTGGRHAAPGTILSRSTETKTAGFWARLRRWFPRPRIARRAFRAVFPRLRHELLDGPRPLAPSDESNERVYRDLVSREGTPPPFITERFAEGRRWRTVTEHFVPGGRVLDVGGADGAIELAFSAGEQWSAFSVEISWNEIFPELRDRTGARIRRVVADAEELPFRDAVFDAVTCLETVEHLRDPRRVAREIARVTRARGALLVTTPPRLRYLLRPDPHFDIRFLLFLPASWQRRVAESRGFRRADHYVDRIYTSSAGLVRLFRGFRKEQVLSRSRAPRRWFWDAILLRRK